MLELVWSSPCLCCYSAQLLVLIFVASKNKLKNETDHIVNPDTFKEPKSSLIGDLTLSASFKELGYLIERSERNFGLSNFRQRLLTIREILHPLFFVRIFHKYLSYHQLVRFQVYTIPYQARKMTIYYGQALSTASG
jgi:hypothetical protein